MFRVEYTNAHTTYTIIDTQGNKTPLPSSTCYCSDFVEGGYALKFVQDKINLRPVYINGKGQEIMSGIYAGKKVYMGSVSGDVNHYARPRCCGMTAWLFLNALYRVGMEKEADAIYFRMLDTFENLPTHSGLFPGYMESVDWRTKDGNPCGYNYLADNYLFLASGFLHHRGTLPD